ncbi:MAG: hypothetical protein QNK11_00550, partial [Legionella sp.]|nr:hypothetical protein [Legionella sp.]
MSRIKNLLDIGKQMLALAHAALPPHASNETFNIPEPHVTENTWVYVWNLTSNKVGHTAIQVGGDTPKFKNNDGM